MADLELVPDELVSFLESATEPHILVDRKHRILAANSAYRAKCGESEEIVGRACFEVSHHYHVPCDQAGESCPMALSIASKERQRVVHLHYTPTGENYENIELVPICDVHGNVAYFVEKFEPLAVARALAGNDELVGRSPAFTRMLEMVARVAPTETTVLLEGATGTGKELVARAIHDASPRAGQPFVVVDCSGLPETLFESELFGHEKGAFTGAATLKHGLIEAANGGTLFLDEVGDIPLVMQVKLLRLIETGTYRRVGGTELRRADVRLVSATNLLLDDQVAAGRFRQDLYYRLNIFQISLPRLRDRRVDLPMLVDTLLRRVARSRTLRLSQSALALLIAYDYPGNVRELRNILERASVMCDGEVIGLEHLPESVHMIVKTDDSLTLPIAAEKEGTPVTLKEIETELLQTLITSHQGTRKELALKLGISERTIYRKFAQITRLRAGLD
jgi:transcriptional regulator with PAS, ATPase and Fis domain